MEKKIFEGQYDMERAKFELRDKNWVLRRDSFLGGKVEGAEALSCKKIWYTKVEKTEKKCKRKTSRENMEYENCLLRGEGFLGEGEKAQGKELALSFKKIWRYNVPKPRKVQTNANGNLPSEHMERIV